MPATLKLPLPPVSVPGEVVPSPQLIEAEYALAVALVFGSVKAATVPPTALPVLPVNEKPPLGTVSTIVVSNDTVASYALGEIVDRILDPHGVVKARQLRHSSGNVEPRSDQIVGRSLLPMVALW